MTASIKTDILQIKTEMKFGEVKTIVEVIVTRCNFVHFFLNSHFSSELHSVTVIGK